jgi:hypothetical protein
MDPVVRDFHFRRIRDLRVGYRLDWLVTQESFAAGGVENLDDDALAALLAKMEDARECIADGVDFEAAGLVRRCGD